MNKDKLKKLIYDMESENKDLEESLKLLENFRDNEVLKKELSNSLRYKYLSMFILYEDFISMLLKEYNLYKIGMSIDSAIKILKEKSIFSEELSNYLNASRLLRNRIGHRYKQPKIEALIDFINENKEVRYKMFEFIKSFS
ncbi:hypothetical protein H9X78_13730 [Clostridium saudiense]|nr:hypothetical protein [Clostridium saudiense]